jgi:hypothetical protein
MCEQLVYSTLPSGEYIVFPNDMNLPQSVTELKIENEELRNGYKELLKKFEELNEKFNHMMEGYDLL